MANMANGHGPFAQAEMKTDQPTMSLTGLLLAAEQAAHRKLEFYTYYQIKLNVRDDSRKMEKKNCDEGTRRRFMSR